MALKRNISISNEITKLSINELLLIFNKNNLTITMSGQFWTPITT